MVLMLTAAGGARRTRRRAGARSRRLSRRSPSTSPNSCFASMRSLAESRSAAPGVLRFGGYRARPAAAHGDADGGGLDLTPKEFAVLEVLLRAEPGVVSAEELLERAWDEHADPFTRTVSVTISRLRRKLGRAGRRGDRRRCGLSDHRAIGVHWRGSGLARLRRCR